MRLFKRFLEEWEEEKKFINLKSVIKAKTEDIITFLDKIATVKGKKSWLVIPPTSSESKICLVAHIDRIFDNPQKKKVINKKGKWTSPQGISGDDRCGVYGLLHLFRTLPANRKPYILFTHEEERGMFGAKEAVEVFKTQLKDVDYFIELDRHGSEDMVFYNEDPKDFQKHIEKHGFKKSKGSASDITVLGRKFHKKSVNLSIGYYKQHTKEEHVIVKEMLATIAKVKNICIQNEPSPNPDWKYEKPVYKAKEYKGVEWGNWGGFDNDRKTIKNGSRYDDNSQYDFYGSAYNNYKDKDDTVGWNTKSTPKSKPWQPQQPTRKWSEEDEKKWRQQSLDFAEKRKEEQKKKAEEAKKKPIGRYDDEEDLFHEWMGSGSDLKFHEWKRKKLKERD